MAEEHTIDLNISTRLEEDEEFRKGFFRAVSRNEIAAQIVALRKRRKMRQGDLAKAVNTGQSAISRLEKAEYASWNYQTLLGIAEALQARLNIKLEPFEDVIAQYKEQDNSISQDAVTSSALVLTAESIALNDFSRNLESQQKAWFSNSLQSHAEYSLSS